MNSSPPNGTEIAGPAVSIVVSVLDGGCYVRNLTDYLNRQTFSDTEVIFIVSCNSKDNSLEEVEKAVGEIKNSSYYLYEDTGRLGGSKNLGLKKSKGRYLWFLDVDDYPSIHFLEEAVRIKEENGADVVGCNFVYSTDYSPFKENDDEFKVITVSGSEAVLMRATEKFPVTSWSMLYDRKMIQKNGIGFAEGLCEDIDFTYKVLLHSDKVCYYTKPMYKYTARIISENGKRSELMMFEIRVVAFWESSSS